MITAHAYSIPDGIRGFDANQRISAAAATAMRAHGYRFCVRYVRRADVNPHDLSGDEVQDIFGAGLGVMPVQHVKSEKSWVPTAALGTKYGGVAASESQAAGIGLGVCVWCDLEGVATGTPAQVVIDFCNNWHKKVAAAGYVPGLYVGWHAGLSPKQLYNSLRFSHFWAAYNLNSDEYPAVRGVQMKQKAAAAGDVPGGTALTIDVDVVNADSLGGRPIMFAPAGWTEG